MGSQRVRHDLATEQQQCKDRRKEGSVMKKYIKKYFYLSFIGHNFKVCWEVILETKLPFSKKAVTLLCRQFGRNEMYFACSVAQSYPTLCDPMDYRPPGLSVHGILSMAKILEWVAISCSKGSSRPRGRTCVSFVSFIDRQILYLFAT